LTNSAAGLVELSFDKRGLHMEMCLVIPMLLLPYFGCQNIRKSTAGRLNVGKEATTMQCSSSDPHLT